MTTIEFEKTLIPFQSFEFFNKKRVFETLRQKAEKSFIFLNFLIEGELFELKSYDHPVISQLSLNCETPHIAVAVATTNKWSNWKTTSRKTSYSLATYSTH